MSLTLPDQRQREEALDISRSFIVQAPAGSGKTQLLTQRYLKLLVSPFVKNPEEIIAITFTRKAASEMRARILAELTDGESSRLRIMTIDKFCKFLVSQLPLQAKLSESFSIAENPEILYQKAIQNLFSNPKLSVEKCLTEFLLYLDNDMRRVIFLLTDILKSRDQWLCHMPRLMHHQAILDLENAWKNIGLSYSPDQKKIVENLSEVLLLLLTQLQLVFDETNQYDFIEIALRALEALGDEDSPTDLALKLDYQIKHLLIDEFQDTSATQWRLLQKLTAGWQSDDGKTLFLVGDPMQSIYRFRKAEVGLFLEAQKNGIHHLKLTPLVLTANFRSDPSLIHWFNQSFSKIFPRKADSVLGAMVYTSSLPANTLIDDASQSLQQSSAFYHAIDNNVTSESEKILEILAQHADENVAILVRSRTHLKEIIEVLQKNKLSFRALDIAMLEDNPVIQDLFSLTRALMHPADRIAWLAILRAPWCGFDLQTLHQLAGEDHESTIWDLLIESKCLTDNMRYQHFMSALTWAMNMRGKLSLRQWIEKTWLKLKGYYCLSHKNFSEQLKLAEKYFDLLDETQNNYDCESIQNKLQHLVLPADTDKNIKIDIMTIHKAKGLEFDVVILPALEKTTRADSSKLLLWEERINSRGEMDLLVAPMPYKNTKENIYDYLKQAESQRADYELQRLLYVAATRAKKTLHLLFSVNLKNPQKKSFLHLIWPFISDQYPLKNKREKNQQRMMNNALFKRFSASILKQVLVSEITLEQNNENEKIPELNVSSTQDQRAIGIIVHEALYLMSQQIPVTEKYLKMRLWQLTQSDEQFKIIQQCLENLRSDEHAKWILKSHKDAKSEYALTTKSKGDTFEHIIVDRTFIECVDGEEVRWIIDYKITDNISLESYRSQLEKYAEIISQQEIRPIYLGLYFPLNSHFIQWRYK